MCSQTSHLAPLRRSRFWRFCVSACLSAFLAFSACSGPEPAPTLAVGEFSRTLATRICQVQATCTPSPDYVEAGCIWQQLLRGWSDSGIYALVLRSAMATDPANGIAFDSAAARECVEAIDCENAAYVMAWLGSSARFGQQLVNVPAACARVFSGQFADGQLCVDSIQCQSGTCAWTGEPCYRCIPPIPEGKPVGNVYAVIGPATSPCAAGSDVLGGVCAHIGPRGLGDTCDHDGAWRHEFDCTDGLTWCAKTSPSESGTCIPWTPTGAPCANSSECGPGTVCLPGAVTSTCTATSAPLRPFTTTCGSTRCRADEQCVKGSCKETARLGEACVDVPFDQQHDFYRPCLDGVCVGGSCQPANCQPGCALASCRPDGKCRIALPGDPCQVQTDCSSVWWMNCVDGKCVMGGNCVH